MALLASQVLLLQPGGSPNLARLAVQLIRRLAVQPKGNPNHIHHLTLQQMVVAPMSMEEQGMERAQLWLTAHVRLTALAMAAHFLCRFVLLLLMLVVWIHYMTIETIYVHTTLTAMDMVLWLLML